MTQRLTNKTALVTAAGQGIGRATAEAYMREGARVIATDINAALLETLPLSNGSSVRRLDVTDAAAIAALSEARTAMVEAHAAADELRLRLGIRTRMGGSEQKVEDEATTETGLREVA